jgi:hypothetical protein
VPYVLVGTLALGALLGTASSPSEGADVGRAISLSSRQSASKVTAHTNTASATTKSQLRTKLLVISDMPAGWLTTSISEGSGGSGIGGCLSPPTKQDVYASTSFFNDSANIQAVFEVLESGPHVAEIYGRSVKRLDDCHRISNGEAITAISFPSIGAQSSAYALSGSAAGKKVYGSVIVFRQGPYMGILALTGTSQVDTALLQTFGTRAIAQLSAATVNHASSGPVVVTCTTVSHNEISCVAPGWESAYSITFGGGLAVPKNLGACLTRELPHGYRYLFDTPQSNGRPSAAEQRNASIINKAEDRCSQPNH